MYYSLLRRLGFQLSGLFMTTPAWGLHPEDKHNSYTALCPDFGGLREIPKISELLLDSTKDILEEDSGYIAIK